MTRILRAILMPFELPLLWVGGVGAVLIFNWLIGGGA